MSVRVHRHEEMGLARSLQCQCASACVCARAEELHDSTANAKLLQFDRNSAAVPVPEMLQLMPSVLDERPLPPASLGLAAGASAPGGVGGMAAHPHGALGGVSSC